MLNNKVHAVIVGHGDFPQGIFSAAEKIVGPMNGVKLISNQGLDVEAMVSMIEEKVSSATKELYVFVDLIGGSCYNACRLLIPDHPDWVLIAGVNLPMLVTYLSYRNRLNPDELCRKVLDSGCRGMKKFS